jgi:hypothetical protein
VLNTSNAHAFNESGMFKLITRYSRQVDCVETQRAIDTHIVLSFRALKSYLWFMSTVNLLPDTTYCLTQLTVRYSATSRRRSSASRYFHQTAYTNCTLDTAGLLITSVTRRNNRLNISHSMWRRVYWHKFTGVSKQRSVNFPRPYGVTNNAPGQVSTLFWTEQHYTTFSESQTQWHPLILATSGSSQSRPTYADG